MGRRLPARLTEYYAVPSRLVCYRSLRRYLRRHRVGGAGTTRRLLRKKLKAEARYFPWENFRKVAMAQAGTAMREACKLPPEVTDLAERCQRGDEVALREYPKRVMDFLDASRDAEDYDALWQAAVNLTQSIVREGEASDGA